MNSGNKLDGMFPIERSTYYAFYLREKEEILKHQWVLGERNHGDVTYNYAQWDWILRHRPGWIEALRASGEAV